MEKQESMTRHDRENLKRICNRLLSCCFLCKGKESSKSDYYFVIRYKEIFRERMEQLGYTLEINENYGVIQLTSPHHYNRLHLKLIESIILLLLRVLYDEGKRELSVSDQVIVNVGDINALYRSLNIREKMIEKTAMRNSLALFRRMQLIEILDRELADEDARILIYDSILMAVRAADIKETYEKLENYRRGKTSDEDTDEAETD